MAEKVGKNGGGSGSATGGSDPGSEPVLYNIKRKVAYITINTKMNTVNIETAKKLVHYLSESEKNPKVRVIVLRSSGNEIFSAGFDLGLFKELNDKVINDLLTYGRDISRAIFFNCKPVIAQIQGSAIGLGCIMAFSADFRIVAEKEELFFRLPELSLKIYPATGPTFTTVSLLGLTRAKDMLLTARKVYLKELKEWGVITRTAPPEELDSVVEKFAGKIATAPTSLLATTKTTINIMAKEAAKAYYDLENDMARYYFASMWGKVDKNEVEFSAEMWKKYGKGRPMFGE